MKKVATYILFGAFFLNITSCDFLRSVAGRPTSGDIALMSKLLEVKKQHESDSLKTVAEAEKLCLENEAAVQAFSELGIKTSSVFSFGDPLEPLQEKYHIVVGVFRTEAAASALERRLCAAGFECSSIFFDGGIRALILAGGNELPAMLPVARAALESGVCPKDAWIHVNE